MKTDKAYRHKGDSSETLVEEKRLQGYKASSRPKRKEDHFHFELAI